MTLSNNTLHPIVFASAKANNPLVMSVLHVNGGGEITHYQQVAHIKNITSPEYREFRDMPYRKCIPLRFF